MPGDTSSILDEIEPRVEALGERVARLEALRGRIQNNLVGKKAEVQALGVQIDKISKVEVLFRALLDLLVVKQVKALEAVITDGLQTIFHDQDLHFESEISTKYNKVNIDFFLRQGASDDPLAIRGRPLDSFGGGPSSVASLILRVLALQRLKRFPLLALDETLAAVSEDYVDNTGQFLKVLAEKTKMDVLLVTHKMAYLDHATRGYRSLDVYEKDRHLMRLKAVS